MLNFVWVKLTIQVSWSFRLDSLTSRPCWGTWFIITRLPFTFFVWLQSRCKNRGGKKTISGSDFEKFVWLRTFHHLSINNLLIFTFVNICLTIQEIQFKLNTFSMYKWKTYLSVLIVYSYWVKVQFLLYDLCQLVSWILQLINPSWII